ncbi:PAS domain-containing protein, partial [Arthrospira platensis SPKY1]|nr:PAS domain-containing protein [Arthrospira platensis SPKY1]
SISDIFFELDSENQITYISPAITNHTGLQPAMLIGKDIAELFVNLDQDEIRQRLSQKNYAHVFVQDIRLKKEDATYKWIQLMLTPVIEDGLRMSCRGRITDIHER